MSRKPRQLTVIFDGECVLCQTSVHWLQRRQTYVSITSIPAKKPEALAAYGDIAGYGDNMVVVADDGRSWVGPPDAYLVVMWAVKGLRALSYLLALPGLRQLTGQIFQIVAGNRHLLTGGKPDICEHCVV